MKRAFFSILFLLLFLTLQADSQTHPVTIDLNGSPTGSSNISSNGSHTTYTRYTECWITDLDPDGDGHYHVYDWEPSIYPDQITASIKVPAKGYGYVQGQLDSAIVNGTQLITGSGGKVTTGAAGTWWIDYDAMKPKAQEAYYTHYVNKKVNAPSGLDTKYDWSTSGRGDCYSVYWRGSASVGVTLTTGVTASHNGIGVSSTAALLKSGQVTWSQSNIVQNGEGGSGGGTWKVVHKERCRVCKDEVPIHDHQRLCNGCLEWYECYKHPGDHIEVSCPQKNGVNCSYESYYKCSPHTHAYTGSGSGNNNGGTPPTGSTPPPSPSYHACNVHLSSVSGDHSLQASCSSTDFNGNSCTVTNFYACDGHTHVYPEPPPPPTVSCGRRACTGTVSSTDEHSRGPCPACGKTYWSCGQYGSYHYNNCRERTCRYGGCGNKWRRCQSNTPYCSNNPDRRCWAM